MVIGLPVLLGLVWWSGQTRTPNATADVTIDTPDVDELRRLAISRLGTIDAVKVVEDTAFAGDGESDLTFRVPAGRLDEALQELKDLGGVITRQRVRLDEFGVSADDLASRLDGVTGCLAGLSEQLGSGTPSRSDIDECRRRVDDTGQQIAATPEVAEDAVLNVHITKKDTTNPALVIAVILLALALATMAYLTIRSTRADRIYDLTEPTPPSRTPDDLYHRRN